MRCSFVVVLTLTTLACSTCGQSVGDAELVYQWVAVDYDWPQEGDREEAIANGTFIVENNIITGIKVYEGEVFVTVSRWLPGVPSTMNKVVMKGGQPVLQPYPSWGMQEIGRHDTIAYF